MWLDPSYDTDVAQEIVAQRTEFSTFLTYPSKNISYLLIYCSSSANFATILHLAFHLSSDYAIWTVSKLISKLI
jgi:hypothetical protein